MKFLLFFIFISGSSYFYLPGKFDYCILNSCSKVSDLFLQEE